MIHVMIMIMIMIRIIILIINRQLGRICETDPAYKSSKYGLHSKFWNLDNGQKYNYSPFNPQD